MFLWVLIMEKKKCSRCGSLQNKSEFYKCKERKDGLTSACKFCLRSDVLKYYSENKEASIARVEKYRALNKQKMRESGKRYNNEHKEERKTYNKQHKKELKEHYRKWRNEWQNKPKRRISRSLALRMRQSLKDGKGGVHWEQLVGYTAEMLKKHLEKQFEPWMSWKNYGKDGWEIDHKIPISVFNFTKPEHRDFKRCWALKNLQPLRAKDNRIKSNKLDKPFQPSLCI